MGGLGNQLFQIYTLIAHSMETDVAFSLNNDKMLYGPVRNYDLYWTNVFKNLVPFLKDNLSLPTAYQEPGFKYNTIPKFTNGKLVGYFQSWKYFDKYVDTINVMLGIQQQRDKVKDKVKVKVGDVSIHFRVGDYKVLQHCHPLMPKEYYEKALKNITLKHGAKVTYFYERADHEHVQNIIAYLENCFGDKYVFEPIVDGLDDYEEMFAMSLCKYNIIANSSFSWWAAYLNNNPNKVVYFPSLWFGPKLKLTHDTSDLCPSSWNMITVN